MEQIKTTLKITVVKVMNFKPDTFFRPHCKIVCPGYLNMIKRGYIEIITEDRHQPMILPNGRKVNE